MIVIVPYDKNASFLINHNLFILFLKFIIFLCFLSTDYFYFDVMQWEKSFCYICVLHESYRMKRKFGTCA